MSKEIKLGLYLSLTLLFVAGALSAPAIHLKGSTFIPSETEMPESSHQGLSTASESIDTNAKILQFKNPVKKSYRHEMEQATGVQFRSYIPENAWIVQYDGSVDKLLSYNKVRYVGPYRPSYRIDPDLINKRSSGQVTVRIEMFSGKRYSDILSQYGGVTGRSGKDTVFLKTSYTDLAEISSLEEVRYISRPSPSPTTLNDDSRKLIDVNRLQDSQTYNLTGKGFTAAIWDAGWAGEHDDLNYTLAWTGNSKTIRGDAGGFCGGCIVKGHGTHVAGTMVGGGILNDSYRGMAPDSRLITYEWPGVDNYYEDEIFSELKDASNNYNSILSQNSWGFSIDDSDDRSNNDHYLMGDYGYVSEYYDNITANESSVDPLSIIFSAGNEGGNINTEQNNWTTRYNTTTGAGTTSKNTITVGAVNDGGQMTVYSSWGPTDDGRIKPTVVADGGRCYSIKSTYPGNRYVELCGTSMAAPAVSGAAILLNQQFNKTYGEVPSPAAVKGLMVHTAEDVNRTGPDYITGWGLVNTTEAVEYVKQSRIDNNIRTGSVSQDSNDTYRVNVSKGDSANFTLVWSDYPGTSGSDKALINNLDLVIRNSTGHRYYPWTLNWSTRKEIASRDKPDQRNTVEQVYIPEVKSDTLTISVNGTQVPEGPQDYSLIMSDKVQVVPELDVESPLNESYSQTPDFNFSSSNPLVSAKFSIDSGKNYSLANISSDFFYNTTTSITEGRHNVTFWAEYSKGNWTSVTEYFTTDYTKPYIEPVNPVNGTNLSGTENITALWSDDLSGIDVKVVFVENSTDLLLGRELNFTFNSSKFKDDKLAFDFIAQDNAGNVNETVVDATLDNSPPNLTSHTPVSGTFRDNFTVNSSYKDDTTGVETAKYWLTNSSGIERTGEFNDSVNSSKYGNGEYNLSFRLKDYADNLLVKNVSITIDNADPELNVLSPLNGSFVGTEFWINASVNGTFSSIVEKQFNVSNSTFSKTGDFNGTFNTLEVSEGEYNITYTTSDEAGNEVSERVNVTLDKTRPSLNLTLPNDSTVETGNFTVNTTYNDSLAGIDSAKYYIRNSSGLQLKGALNATVNSSKLQDGSYTIGVEVNDTAGNLASEEAEIDVDNSPPVLEFSTLNTGDNLTGNFEIEAQVSDIAGLDKGLFRWYNSSGNVTDWRQVNTTFDFDMLETGEYNFSYRFNDTLGMTSIYNKTKLTVDNSEPEISLQEYTRTGKYRGWLKDSITVKTSCTDTGSGFKSAFVSINTQLNSSTVTPVNFTVSDNGNNSYRFECTDYTGNTILEERIYSIDAQAPEITSVSPEQDVNTDRNVTITGEFNDETLESGLNVSSSNLQVSKGDIVYTQWSNNSFTAEITNLSYSTDFSLTGGIFDNVGHSYNVDLSYSTRSKPQTSSSGPSLPSGGSNNSSNETETPQSQTVYETLENGLKVRDLNLTQGEVERINVSNYSSGTVSKINLRGASSGLTGVDVSGLNSSDFTVPQGIESQRFVHMNIVNSSRLENITVEFEVDSSWIDSTGLGSDSVSLFRAGPEWERIETSLIREGSVLLYRSELEGFSNFSVAAEKACRGESVYAVDPEGQACKAYDPACEKPGSWSEVSSCQSWSDRKEVEKVIQNLTEKGASEQKIEGIREEYNKGNYSGAMSLAEQIQGNNKDEGNILVPVVIGLVLIVILAGGGFAGYIYYSRQQLEQEINELGEKLIDQSDQQQVKSHQEALDKIMHAKKALDMNKYSKAQNHLEKYKERARKEDLPQ